MMKPIQAPMTLILALFLVGSSIESAPAATLRDRVMVEGDVVTLADLFNGVGKQATTVVGTAPKPGRRQVFGSYRLNSLARSYNLDWKPSGRYDRVTITRASRVIEMDEVESNLRSVLIERGMPPSHKLEITSRGRDIRAAAGALEPFRIQNARMNDRGNRFTAVLEIATGNSTFDRLQISGKVFSMVKVPVLNRRFRNGDIIREDDLVDLSLPRYKLRHDVILDHKRIVGLTPRRLLDQGVPLSSSDIRRPIVVARGKMVMLVVKTKRMLLTARGRALHDAAKGDTVKVVNTRSNTMIEGVVVGPNRVSIPNAPSIQ